MANYKRIAILGNAGSGKSTLTFKINKILDLTIYHLDKYFWKPNWVRSNLDEYKIVHDNLCNQDKWIIDGMNLKFLDYRISKADLIIFLDVPRYKCFWRIFKRTIKYYGKETPSSAQGCHERINWEFFTFLKWVWNFKSDYNPKIKEIFTKHNDKEFYILKTQKDIDSFLEKLELKKDYQYQ